ncbi:MAG TPA: GAF domain-containing protein [Gaiellaceae bacterium]|nr:GAF domain-containing protein [Gaiellaceae bacterium]
MSADAAPGSTRPVDQTSEIADVERRLLAIGIALSTELSLDGVLQHVVEAAASLTGARFAALGVVERSGARLERFITTGIDSETRARIGELPEGRGILGAATRSPRPLRLRDLAQDPRAVGFPPGHPPMKTFLGVPIRIRGAPYGSIYLTEKESGEEFTERDEEVVAILAAQAAVAIENARLNEASAQWLRQLETLIEVGDSLATEIEPQRLLELIAVRLRELVDARLVAVWAPASDGLLRIVAAAGEEAETLLGLRASLADRAMMRVFEHAVSARSDSVPDDPEVDQSLARRLGVRAAVWVPMPSHGRSLGVIGLADKLGADASFSGEDVRLAEIFARRAAVAIELGRRVARDQVRSIVQAQELERRRLARELHDETGQALAAILLALKPLESQAGEEALRPIGELVMRTLDDVRRLAVELRPPILDDFGLAPALERLSAATAQRAGIRVTFEPSVESGRFPDEIETALYRLAQEALTNVVKHAEARHVRVLLTWREGVAALAVEDDGRGFNAQNTSGHRLGIVGMHERAALLDGTVTIASKPGAGTRLVAEFPTPVPADRAF